MAMVNVVYDMRDLYIEHQSFKLKDFSVTNNIFYLLEWPPLASVSIFWRPYPMLFLSNFNHLGEKIKIHGFSVFWPEFGVTNLRYNYALLVIYNR